MSLIWLAVSMRSFFPFSMPPSQAYASRVKIAICAVVALVETTAFSGPALIGITMSEIRAIVDDSTFTRDIILVPFACAVSIASMVSAVSPD